MNLNIEEERREFEAWYKSEYFSERRRPALVEIWLAAKRAAVGSAEPICYVHPVFLKMIAKTGFEKDDICVEKKPSSQTVALFLAPPAPVSAEPRPEEEAEEDAAVIHKLATILAGVCVALKGEELPLHRHSYHDIVDVAQTMKLELELYRMQAASAPPSTDAKDAARYRWLRDDPNAYPCYVIYPDSMDSVDSTDMDKLIDAAIAAKGAGK